MHYQITLTLVGTEPSIWRRLLVSDDTPLNIFHRVIQIAMGWLDYHAHQFVVAGKKAVLVYGVAGNNEVMRIGIPVLDEKCYRLSDLLHAEGDQCTYEYDFGDKWLHQLFLERKIADDISSQKFCCLEGKGACPPEDSGGVSGYEEWLMALNNRNHPDHEDAVEWLGADYNPFRFEREEINKLFTSFSLSSAIKG